MAVGVAPLLCLPPIPAVDYPQENRPDGRIVEDGLPSTLLSAGGWYAAMGQLQTLGWENST